MTTPNFQIGQAYTFSVYATAFLGTGYTAAVVDSLMNYTEAMKQADVAALHTQVYPSIPSGNGVPDDPKQYNYVKIKTTSGVSMVLGLTWIDATTVEQVATSTITVVISGNVGPADVNRINNALVANGYNSFQTSIS